MSELQPLKRLSYRDATKVLYKVSVGATIFVALILVRMRLVNHFDEPLETLIFKLALACSVPFSILMRLFFWIRPRIYSIYEVYPDQFVRVFRKKREVNKFENIKSIKISLFSPRFLGGFTVTMDNGQKTTFLSALKNGHKLLELIAEARPGLLNQKQLESYLRLSRVVDVSWRRMKEKVWNWKLVLVKYIGIPFGLSGLTFLWDHGSEVSLVLQWSEWVIVLLVFGIVFDFVLNVIEEKIALKTVTWVEDKDKYTRDRDQEKRIAQWFTGLYGVGMLGIFLGVSFFL